MIEKTIANHILDSFEDISYFLTLCSYCVVNNCCSCDFDEEKQSLMELYEKSGLLTVEEGKAVLKVNGSWLAALPEIKTTKRKEKKQYIPQHLLHIINYLKYPIDWHQNMGKYLKNYFRISKKYSPAIMDQALDYVTDNDIEVDLNMFLTESIFKNLKDKT